MLDASKILLDCVIFAARSILPLNVFMILLIVCVLRRDLPDVSYEPPYVAGLLEDDHHYEDPSGRQHMSAYGSIRQHTAAYVSIRQHVYLYLAYYFCIY
jgi:hypothetical protein